MRKCLTPSVLRVVVPEHIFKLACVYSCVSVCDCASVSVCTHRLSLCVIFIGSDVELHGSGSELVEGRSQFKAVLEQTDPSKDVEAKSGPGHGYYQPSHISVERGRG